MITRGLILLFALSACGPKRGSTPADGPPTWATPSGREQSRLDLVRVLLDSDQVHAALSLLGSMREEGAKGPDIDILQARALRRLGMWEDAEPLLARIPKGHGDYGYARNELGLICMDRGDVPSAIDAFRAASRASPDDASYLNNLGFALLSDGQVDPSIEVFRRSLAVDASQPRTRNNLGFALVAASREDEALRVFRASGQEADARYNLGVGLELRGELDRARNAYASALEVDPDHMAARDSLARLQTPPLSQEP